MRVSWKRAIKRARDMAVALTGLTACAPVFAGVAGVVLVSMGRPLVFIQRRVGRDERVFRIIKFRTMREERFPGEPDELRIPRVGTFLRRSSLDELPQLLNILNGDMSLVGPRPLLVAYLDRYSPRQRRRHSVPPGITGLSQVSGRNGLGWKARFRTDVRYVKNWSLREDLRILARTADGVVRGTGVSEEGSMTMTEFKGPLEHR